MSKIKLLEDCVYELARLPSIGRKTATRLAMHIIRMNADDVHKLASRITAFKDNAVFCSVCGGLSESDVCPICTDEYRDKTSICVVEEVKDLFVVEQTGYFKGVYHVLGGKISPLEGIGPDNLRIDELIGRIAADRVKEVILATNPDVDGETTATYLARKLKHFTELKITKLASGIPLGTHIEYADEMTMLRAIEGRRQV
ncbi:recombination mediator RecR [Deferribacterales bacterium RsTz2092]|nr:recombination protein RecR [Deferribacterales bacterium]